METLNYIHGYSEREAARLSDQANTLSELLHYDTIFPAGSRVLEAGCGTGAQTLHIALRNPDTAFISVDVQESSLERAQALSLMSGITNVVFKKADIFSLPFPAEYFDHVFVCFVLEHIDDPVRALTALKLVLKRGGSVTVIEGDHGSVFFHPETEEARRVIQVQLSLQAEIGGDAAIGRKLFPLLKAAGFSNCRVSPRLVYADPSRPALAEGFTLNTFTAMIEGIRQRALEKKLMSAEDFDKGISDLRRTAGPDGVFCYTFFKGGGIRP